MLLISDVEIVKKKMHSKEHMYVSGLEISRAAAASHKVGKGKKGTRFQSEKRARSFVQKRFGVIFCSCSSNCVNVYVYMGLSTLAAPSLNRSQNVDNI